MILRSDVVKRKAFFFFLLSIMLLTERQNIYMFTEMAHILGNFNKKIKPKNYFNFKDAGWIGDSQLRLEQFIKNQDLIKTAKLLLKADSGVVKLTPN